MATGTIPQRQCRTHAAHRHAPSPRPSSTGASPSWPPLAAPVATPRGYLPDTAARGWGHAWSGGGRDWARTARRNSRQKPDRRGRRLLCTSTRIPVPRHTSPSPHRTPPGRRRPRASPDAVHGGSSPRQLARDRDYGPVTGRGGSPAPKWLTPRRWLDMDDPFVSPARTSPPACLLGTAGTSKSRRLGAGHPRLGAEIVTVALRAAALRRRIRLTPTRRLLAPRRARPHRQGARNCPKRRLPDGRLGGDPTARRRTWPGRRRTSWIKAGGVGDEAHVLPTPSSRGRRPPTSSTTFVVLTTNQRPDPITDARWPGRTAGCARHHALGVRRSDRAWGSATPPLAISGDRGRAGHPRRPASAPPRTATLALRSRLRRRPRRLRSQGQRTGEDASNGGHAQSSGKRAPGPPRRRMPGGSTPPLTPDEGRPTFTTDPKKEPSQTVTSPTSHAHRPTARIPPPEP